VVLKAYGGRTWCARAHRLPAKQSIRGKTELLGAWDVHRGKLWLRFFQRKRAKEVIRFLDFLRKRYPRNRLYLILDCWRVHRSKALKAYLRGKPITLVELPTNCSWLNPIERVFSEVQTQVLDNSNFRNLRALKQAVRTYGHKEFPKANQVK
jgi:transposase